MPIYPRGSGFMVSVGSGTNRYRQSFKTLKEAQEAEQKALQALKKGGLGDTSGKTLEDAYNLTWRLHWASDKSAKTHSTNAKVVLRTLGEKTPLADLTTETITDAIFEWEEEGNSGSTINRKISNLSMMLKTAADQGWLDKLPKIPRRKEGKHRIRWLDEQEEARVLATAKHLGLDDLHDFIVVAIDTGFRKSELLGFESRDFVNGLLHLHAGSTKNDDARSVPATDRVRLILQRRSNMKRPFEALTVAGMRYQWSVLKEALGLSEDPQFVIHMLRHTCASRLVQKGVPLAVVQRWMGHKNIQTTLRYAHLAPDNLLEAMQKLQGAPTVPHLKVV